MNNFRNKRLFDYGMKTKSSLIAGFVFAILAMATDVVGPYVLGLILDGQLIEGVGAKDANFFTLLLVTYFVTMALASVFGFAYNYYFNKTASKVAMLMQEDVFNHIQSLPISYYDKMPAGQIVSRITNDTRDVKELYRLVLSQIVIALVYAIGIYFALARIDYRLALLGLIPLPIIWFLLIQYKNKSKKYNYAQRRALAKFNSDLNENIEGMEIIQAFNEEDYIYEELDKINREIYANGLGFTKVFAGLGNNAIMTLQNLTNAFALFFFGYGTISGKFPASIGLFYTFTNYMIQLFGQLRIVVLRSGELEKSITAADHIFEILQIEKEDFGEKKVKVEKGEISFEDVSFSYDGENYILKDINIDVAAGEQIALVGHTGSGKSTIMNLLFAYYEPQKGTIKIDGMDIKDFDKRVLRENMSIVLQDTNLFTGTVKDNITLFDDEISDERVEEALIEVGGEELLRKLRNGIHSPLSTSSDNLSSGEKQIISFARAIVGKPKILVLDEATSNIDTETEGIIQKGVRSIGRGRTMLIIAHRLSTIKHVDTIYVLDSGRVVEQGSHNELIKENGIYKAMYEAQSQENDKILQNDVKMF